MALRLSTSQRSQSVPIRIVSGLPLPFENIFRQFKREELTLLFNQPIIQTTSEGLNLISNLFQFISEWEPIGDPPPNKTEIENVRDLTNQIADKIRKIELLKRIMNIREDILGAYFFYRHEIQLYWMVIGLIAKTIGASVQALTVVVLIHELAHAYSHLGQDIDNDNWDTEDFANTDLKIIEGLAQYYTEVVCKKIEYRFPEASVAFNKLLKLQSEPYKDYKYWAEISVSNKSDMKRLGEVIRVSMIQCRSFRVNEYEMFIKILQRQIESLKSK
jgi:hypothetical protein